MVLLATYLATAAPDLTFWDASELTAAARTLGIPHPPGTPLWVLIARVMSNMFSAAGPARAVTLVSVVTSALAGGLSAMMATRWIGARGAVAAAVTAGTMLSIWNNATEAEVYSVSLLASIAMLAAGEYAGRHDVSDDERARWRGVVAWLVGLAIPLHLSVWVAVPASIAFAWRGKPPKAREWASYVAIALLALSAVAVLPLLSQRGPLLDAGHPVTLSSLVDVLRRKQYAVAGLWPRRAPLWLQIGNVFEWADWQVAFGVHPSPEPNLARTALTVAWAWLGVLGLRALWKHDARVGRAMLVMAICGTLGVAGWLNLYAGPSYGAGILPANALHEARERDYFFVLGFWAWGMAAGAGLASIATQLQRRMPAALAALPFALAAVPLVANRDVADRTSEPAATLPRTVGRLLLESVPTNGVLFTAGDNDSFPLWYLQAVEQVRPDVAVITVPMLGAGWYRAQIARREHLLSDSTVLAWRGVEATLRASAESARAARRAVRVSALLDSSLRAQIDPNTGWALEGLVYAPAAQLTPQSSGIDLAALIRASERVPPSSLRPLKRGADPAVQVMQALLRCTGIRDVADSLLVGTCNGG